MNWKYYQNELLIVSAVLIMIGSYLYKNSKFDSQENQQRHIQSITGEIKEAASLKKIWEDKKITKKIDSLKVLVPNNKVKWSKKIQKLSATYKNLTTQELNKLITKLMNIPVEITLLEVKKEDLTYSVKVDCKW